ncbi:HD domain-containing phosphohydrolase [Rhodanobacter sp. T12-5]|uniref:HD-GYP domain-containing protein n=1 Tax=Rhodanobacter sp. T12-5 TaxID=2024611 RepID=UPI0011ED3FA1|nr:HD domain-containing phosphohydrolase [Rhodanobacter sp. T12-5]KAA0071228.1 HD domain-containing protein [Rhodanobacter sp. T12-5]
MTRRSIHPSELKLGQPLPCDAYDGKGKLLLREGHVIATATQLERLTQNALEAKGPPAADTTDEPAKLSPLGLVLAARQHLTTLHTNRSPADFSADVLRIVGMLQRACKANPDLALATVLMRRDGSYTIRHAVNAAIVCNIIGIAMKLTTTELAAMVAAALTMNIGMYELQKKLHSLDGLLDEQQRQAVRGHCEQGVAILREYGVSDQLWLEIVLDHHERPDGSGYPAGKTVEALSLPTQLLVLADVYCARVSHRHYRPAMTPNVALRWLFLNEGMAVARDITALFIKTLGVYPPGTGVRLRNGSIAVVTHRGANGHTPKVASITTHDGLRINIPIRRRGDDLAHSVAEVVDLDEFELSVSMEALWGSDAIG